MAHAGMDPGQGGVFDSLFAGPAAGRLFGGGRIQGLFQPGLDGVHRLAKGRAVFRGQGAGLAQESGKLAFAAQPAGTGGFQGLGVCGLIYFLQGLFFYNFEFIQHGSLLSWQIGNAAAQSRYRAICAALYKKKASFKEKGLFSPALRDRVGAVAPGAALEG